MPVKLNLGQAWDKATAILSANRQVVLVVAGVFFFLPNLIATFILPSQADFAMQMEALGPQPDPEQLMDVMSAYFMGSWWVYVILGLVQAVGMLGLLALLTDTSRPTVGQALAFGGKGVIPYFAAQILMSFAMLAAFFLPIMLGALIHPALALILGLAGFVALIYLWVKFSLLGPAIAIDRIINPLTALGRSWQLTKGNSLRLFAFYLLLGIVIIVLSLVASMVLSLFSVLGAEAGLIASAIGGALISMLLTTVMVGVMAAVHAQLSGKDAQNAAMTFG